MQWSTFMPIALVSIITVGGALVLVAHRHAGARRWAWLAAISAAGFPLAILLHNVASVLAHGEESVSFVLALVVAPVGFAVGTIGAGCAVVGKDRKLGGALLLAGTGVVFLASYLVLALGLSVLVGSGAQAAVETIALPLSALLMAGGAFATVTALAGRRGTSGRAAPA